jgi:hypothetical protein
MFKHSKNKLLLIIWNYNHLLTLRDRKTYWVPFFESMYLLGPTGEVIFTNGFAYIFWTPEVIQIIFPVPAPYDLNCFAVPWNQPNKHIMEHSPHYINTFNWVLVKYSFKSMLDIIVFVKTQWSLQSKLRHACKLAAYTQVLIYTVYLDFLCNVKSFC